MLCMVAANADAEPWYRGKHGRSRVVHLSVTLVGGALFPATEWLEARWAPTECTWCTPSAPDRRVRGWLRWNEPATARKLSHVTAFVVTPIIASGLVLRYTPPTWADAFDDLLPITESMVITLWLTRAGKLIAGRQRPYAHYGLALDHEDNLSFPSGHTSRAVAIGTAAAMVARSRGYPSEPYLWASTATLGLATGYLRIAADKHYVTDVLAGGVLGVAVGLAVPWLMRRELEVVPTRDGVALAGTW